MSVLIVAQLVCDRDGTVYEASPDVIDSPSAIRTAAAGDGWQVRTGGQGRDLCPGCRTPAGRGRPRRLGNLHEAEVVQRYTKQGQSAPQIADALSISESTVYLILTRAGVQRQPKGWPKGKRRGARIGGTHVR
ncbi:helix-turn-helix domain-containing protein [Plantactinospora sp. WMMB782]|uniref:helix-turn-helix domain-containing protein n=1 Tax=Plantactinospora sp. WMMB782 TaxID=3404121 RepID=UPI003B935402